MRTSAPRSQQTLPSTQVGSVPGSAVVSIADALFIWGS